MKWLSNYLVLELFGKLKIKKVRHGESFGIKISLWKSWNFKTYPILFVFQSYFEHYINKWVWSSNFTLRKLSTWDELIKRFNPKQKYINYAHF